MGGEEQQCLWVHHTCSSRRLFCICVGLTLSTYVYIYTLSIVPRSSKVIGTQPFHIPLCINRTRNVTNNARQEQVIPLLTLFTTWPDNETRSKRELRNITLFNWARLKPMVRPIFFAGFKMNTSTQYIVDNGWDVLPVKHTSKSGIPVLKNMFLDVMAKFKSVYYGYANGDVLFDNGLINTLLAVKNASLPQGKHILVVGQRTNVKNVMMKEIQNNMSLHRVSKRGTLFTPMAEDYFLTDSAYPWEGVPGMVIGRRAYDNWLVLNACKQDHTVIDGTPSIIAVHQTTKAGNFEGYTHHDSNYNLGLLYSMYKDIRFVAGRTNCAPWITKNDKAKNVITISKKKKLDNGC